MPTIEELKKVRIQKLKAIESAGLLAYPSESKKTHLISEAIDGFLKLSKYQYL